MKDGCSGLGLFRLPLLPLLTLLQPFVPMSVIRRTSHRAMLISIPDDPLVVARSIRFPALIASAFVPFVEVAGPMTWIVEIEIGHLFILFRHVIACDW
jgi:hypothetical protein